jgi:outer membrane protein
MNMKQIANTALILTCLMSSPLMAADLIDAYNLSLKCDPELLAEAAAVKATGELDAQALANFLPEINLSAENNKVWLERSSATFGGKSDYNSHGYSLTLTQPLFRQQNYVIREQADIAIASADANYAVIEQSLIVRVAERYFDVLGSEDDLSFALAEREAIEKQLEQTQQRFDVGMATITDVTESQAAYDISVASVIAAENALADSKESLRETTGEYLNELNSLEVDTPVIMPEPLDINQWSETAVTQNPALSVAKANVDNAQQNIRCKRVGTTQPWI